MLALSDSVSNALKHDSRQCKLAQSECVAEVNVNAENSHAHEAVDHVTKHVVEFGAVEHSVLKSKFFVVNLVNLLDKVLLPAEKLDCLDVVERLVDIEIALLSLSSLLLADIFLGLTTNVLYQHIESREHEDDEATPANLLETDH